MASIPTTASGNTAQVLVAGVSVQIRMRWIFPRACAVRGSVWVSR